MSSSEIRESPVDRLQKRFNALLLVLVLVLPVAFIAGTAVPEPASVAIIVGVFTSFGFGIFVVAPHAGKLAKQRFLLALADPDEIDDEMMLKGVAHIVGKMGVLMENDQTRGVFQPLFDGYTRALESSYDGVVNNIRSQAARGAGEFDLTEGEINAELEGMFVDKVSSFIEPFLEKVGAGDRGKQIIRAKVMRSLHGSRGNGGTGSAEISRGGGVDFRRG